MAAGEGGRKYRRLVNYPRQVLVRLSDAERDAVCQRAAEAGLSVSRYVARALTGPGRLPPTLLDREELLRLRFHLEKVGVNLNQIARQLNSWARTGAHPPPPLPEVRAAALAVRQLSREALRRLL